MDLPQGLEQIMRKLAICVCSVRSLSGGQLLSSTPLIKANYLVLASTEVWKLTLFSKYVKPRYQDHSSSRLAEEERV